MSGTEKSTDTSTSEDPEWFGISMIIFIIHLTNITVMFTPFSGPLSIVKYVIFTMSYLLILIFMWKGSTSEHREYKYVIYSSTLLYLFVWLLVIYFSEDALNKFIDNMTSSLNLD